MFLSDKQQTPDREEEKGENQQMSRTAEVFGVQSYRQRCKSGNKLDFFIFKAKILWGIKSTYHKSNFFHCSK